jgi:hypothetical protein
VQRHEDRLALIADDVSRFVVIPFVRFHNVEYYRLDFPAGVTPRAGKVNPSASRLAHPGSCDTLNCRRSA